MWREHGDWVWCKVSAMGATLRLGNGLTSVHAWARSVDSVRCDETAFFMATEDSA